MATAKLNELFFSRRSYTRMYEYNPEYFKVFDVCSDEHSLCVTLRRGEDFYINASPDEVTYLTW